MSQRIHVKNNNDSGEGSLRQALLDISDGGMITFDGFNFTGLPDSPSKINLSSREVKKSGLFNFCESLGVISR